MAAAQVGWDRHCADFAAAHVKAETGRDIWKELGGAPRNAREAAEVYRKLRGRTLKSVVSKALGLKAVSPLLAMRNDLVLVKSGNLSALGICRGELIECVDNMLPIGRALCCWKVSRFRE